MVDLVIKFHIFYVKRSVKRVALVVRDIAAFQRYEFVDLETLAVRILAPERDIDGCQSVINYRNRSSIIFLPGLQPDFGYLADIGNQADNISQASRLQTF
jgi:hypothetical protein